MILEKEVCWKDIFVLSMILKSQGVEGARDRSLAYYYEEVKFPLEYLHILYI